MQDFSGQGRHSNPREIKYPFSYVGLTMRVMKAGH